MEFEEAKNSSTPSDSTESTTNQTDQSPPSKGTTRKNAKAAKTAATQRKGKTKHRTPKDAAPQQELVTEPATAAQDTPDQASEKLDEPEPTPAGEAMPPPEADEELSEQIEPTPVEETVHSPKAGEEISEPVELPPEPHEAGDIRTVMILVDRIHPKDSNPNEMTPEQQDAYTAEVKRLERLPKPLVVRPREDGDYEPVDGEHGLIAARANGFTQVPCEVINCTESEAIRQGVARNRHGQMNKVKVGRLLRRYITLTGQSNAELEPVFGMREGTVRNRLLYATAGDVRNGLARNGYAPDGDVVIAALQVRQVRHYLKLGKLERDVWLDAGAHLKNAKHKAPNAQEAPAESLPPTDVIQPEETSPPIEVIRPVGHDDTPVIAPSEAVRLNVGGSQEAASQEPDMPQEAETDLVKPHSAKVQKSQTRTRAKKGGGWTGDKVEDSMRESANMLDRTSEGMDELERKGRLSLGVCQRLDAIAARLDGRLQQMREKLKTELVPTSTAIAG